MTASGDRRETAKGPPTEVTIHGIGAGGVGVGRLADGRIVFVHRTAPGDRIQVELTAVKKRWARGRLVELLEPGTRRRVAPCPHYARCGGCTLEHLEYGAQLDAKADLVRHALKRIGGRSNLPGVERHASPREFRYRSRVSFTFRRRGNGKDGAGDVQRGARRWVAGFHELEHPERIVDIDGGCLLPVESVARVWEALRGALGPEADRLPSGRELRLTLREVAEERVLLLVEGGHPGGDPEALVRDVDGLDALWHRPEGAERASLVAGSDTLEEVWLDERFPARPSAFVQVNREAGEELHALALREMGAPRGRRVVDAYCGIGAFGRRLARHGGRVVGIELDAEAAEMARSHPVAGFTLVEGRVEDHLAEALPADLVILNPPRTGVADGVMETLAAAGPDHIVYVSCDPATLARDAGRLGDGYVVRRIQVFDLFPQTAHVETLLTLDRRKQAVRPASPDHEEAAAAD